MKSVAFAVVLCLSSAALAAAPDELGVAKSALRDGLYDIARAHALTRQGAEARLIVLECYAQEDRWDEVGKHLKEWKDAVGGPFEYYRAAAAGDYAKAADLLRKSGSPGGLASAKMLEADLLVKAGKTNDAKKLWNDVVAMSNASERAVALAAINLGEVTPLRKAHQASTTVKYRRLTGLRLGMALMNDPKTVEEGEKLVRVIVRDAPDSEGAQEAFVALAETELAAARWQSAVDAYHEAVETWPDVSKSAKVQEGRGWALMKLGKLDEALEAFGRAERLSTDDQARALAVLKQGDILSEMNRGEESMSRYREVLEKYPKTSVAENLKRVVQIRELESKGRRLYREYRFAEAAAAFSEVAGADPTRKPRMEYYDILCLYGQGRDDAAGKRAKELADGCADVRVRADAAMWLAKFLFNRSEWKESAHYFNVFVEIAPKSAAAPEALTWSAKAAFMDSDFALAIQRVTWLAERYPDSPLKPQALLVQGEALIGLSRFDEAVLVLDAVSESVRSDDRMRAQLLKADALFAMGADNPARYEAALETYRAVRFGGTLTASAQLSVSFKIARTLEKLKRVNEATDQYYAQVVLAYWEGHSKGERFDEEAKVSFARAAFWLVDEYESRGNDEQALSILRLVSESDVPAAGEAAKRIGRLTEKGRFL